MNIWSSAISPNSFTMIAVSAPNPNDDDNTRLRRVVLPLPRKPVRISTEIVERLLMNPPENREAGSCDATTDARFPRGLWQFPPLLSERKPQNHDLNSPQS